MVGLTVKSDDGDDEADGKDEDDKGVDLEARGLVSVESYDCQFMFR